MLAYVAENWESAYYAEVSLTADQFMKTDRVRRLKAKEPEPDGMRYYEITKDSPFQKEHMMALILYSDHTKLCTAFSATFRKWNPSESVDVVKARNQAYWWMSKRLREAIELFGNDGVRRWSNGQNGFAGADLEGPLYTGMSFRAVMPSVSIRMNGPTSFSKQFLVAQNFAKAGGITIELDLQFSHQRFFDTSWFSSFKEEDERLTIGGSFTLRIRSICSAMMSGLEKNKKNKSRVFFKRLFYFDSIISGSRLSEIKVKLTDNDVTQISNGLEMAQVKSEVKQYPFNTLNLFYANKKTVILNLDMIADMCAPQIQNSIFHSVRGRKIMEAEMKENVVAADESVNLLRLDFLNRFYNLEKLIIYTTHQNGFVEYQLSLRALMNVLQNLESVKDGTPIYCSVIATWADWDCRADGTRSWLNEASCSKIESHVFDTKFTCFHDACVNSSNDLLVIKSL